MEISSTSNYTAQEVDVFLIPMQDAHVPLLLVWLRQSHVALWWQDVLTDEQLLDKYRQKLSANWQYPFIICVDAAPVGYIQLYDATKEPELWPNQPEGTYGMDVFVGETKYLRKGIASEAVSQALQFIQSVLQATYCVVDPLPDNTNAINLFKKLGFVKKDHYLHYTF